jgi:hypothetical protein
VSDGRHASKADGDGQKSDYDHSNTKDINELSSGRHSKDDK